jgi:hypothetical protein
VLKRSKKNLFGIYFFASAYATTMVYWTLAKKSNTHPTTIGELELMTSLKQNAWTT